jgi:pyrroloquinoline quinone (PQQ) biosynthesis protein C
MEDLDKKIKKRNELTKYLEYSFINDAAKNFLERHSIANFTDPEQGKNLIDNKTLFVEKWVKYSSQFTRMWLNYLPDKQFDDLVSKKIQDEDSSNKPDKEKNLE